MTAGDGAFAVERRLLTIGLIGLVAWGSAKLSHRSGRQDLGEPLEPAHPPVADPPG